MKKRYWLWIMAAVLVCISAMAVPESAGATNTGGSIFANNTSVYDYNEALSWSLYNGVLTIDAARSGNGVIPKMTYQSTDQTNASGAVTAQKQPWYSYRSEILSIVLSEGITSVGEYAFYGISATSVSLPSTLTTICSHAFRNIAANVTIPSTVKLYPWAFYGATGVIQGSTEDGLTWRRSGSTLTISGSGPMQDYSATAGNAPWFAVDGFTTLNIQSGVTSVGAYAFAGNSSYVYMGELKYINLADTVTSIGDSAFRIYNTDKLQSVSWSANLESIGDRAFQGHYNAQVDISLPKLKTLGAHAFEGCSVLTTVSLPKIETIGEAAFNGCSAISSLTLNKGFTSIGDNAFSSKHELTEVVFTGSASSEGSTIGRSAFSYCDGLTSFQIPESVTSIGESAFYYCTGLTSLQIPASVTSIGKTTFCGCSNMVSLTINGYLDYIGADAFKDVPAAENMPIRGRAGENYTWTFSNGTLTLSGSGAMPDYNKMFLYYSSNTPVYSADMPWDGLLSETTELILPSGMTYIGKYAFSQIAATSVQMPRNLQSIGDYAFTGSNLQTVVWDQCVNLTRIGESAFSSSKLENVDLSAMNNLVYIGETAFSTLTLQSLVIPSSVQEVGGQVCYASTNVSGLWWQGKAGSNVTYEMYSRDTIYFTGSGSMAGYTYSSGDQYTSESCTSPFWKNGHIKNVIIGAGITRVGANLFRGAAIRSVSLPDTLEYIGDYSFYGCRYLSGITLPEGLLDIGYAAFYNYNTGNETAETITIPSHITRLYYGAFEYANISGIVLPDGLTHIGEYAFYNSKLTEITIPASVQSLGSYAFSNCTQLRRIVFAGTAPSGLYSGLFSSVTADVIYVPHSSWDGKIQNYSGTLTWKKMSGACGTGIWQFVDQNTVKVSGNEMGNTAWTAFQLDDIHTLILDTDSLPVGNLLQDLPLTAVIFDRIPENTCDGALSGFNGNAYWLHGQEGAEQLIESYTDITWQAYCSHSGASVTPAQIIAVEAVEPSCMEAGSIAHFRCAGCELLFEEEEAIHLLTADQIAVASTGHSYQAPVFTWAEDGSDCTVTFTCEHGDDTQILNDGQVTVTSRITLEPTCTEQGSKEYIAEVSFLEQAYSNTLTVSLDPLGHQEITVPGIQATCTEAGTKDYIFCERCGLVLQSDEEIDPLGHVDIITLEATEPTCVEDGRTAEHKCQRCGVVLQASTAIPATGHDAEGIVRIVTKEAKTPTCTEDGWTEEISCEYCRQVLTASEAVPATGHHYTEPAIQWAEDGSACTMSFSCEQEDDIRTLTAEITPGILIQPTCTEMGTTRYNAALTFEGKEWTDSLSITDIPAVGHIPVTDDAVEPTDHETGLTEGSHCSVCNAVLTAQETIPALWTYSEDGQTVTAYNGTATEVTIPGDVSMLGTTLFKNNQTIVTVHVPENVISAGTQTFYGMTNAADIYLPKNMDGIEMQTFYNNNARLHTAIVGTTAKLISLRNRNFVTEDGWTLKYFITNATAEPSYIMIYGIPASEAENMMVPAELGGVPVKKLEAGSFAGWDQLQYVTIPDSVTSIADDAFADCPEGLTIYSSVNAYARAWAEENGVNWKHNEHVLTVVPGRDATCTEAGNSAYWKCEACGKYYGDAEGTAEIEENSWIIPATKHTLTSIAAKDATCTEAGNSAYWMCEACGKYYSDAEGAAEIEENSWIIPAINHSLTAIAAKDATCTEAGNSAYWKCEACGKYYGDAEGTIEIEGNSWIIPAINHSLTAIAAKDATCIEAGNSAYWKCEACGKYYGDAEGAAEIEENSWIIPATNHSLTAIAAKDATCIEAGNSAYWKCEACGKYYSDAEGTIEIEGNSWIIPAINHSLTAIAAKDATCTEAGNSAYWKCEACGKYYSDAEGAAEIEENSWTIPATDHEWGATTYDWSYDRLEVTATRKCLMCDHQEQETVDTYRELITAPTENEPGSWRFVSKAFTNEAFAIWEATGQDGGEGSIWALNEMTVIRLPASLKTIEEGAFDNVKAQAVIIPEGCTSIAPGAFVNCKNLQYVYVPAGVEIPENAFIECPNLVIDQK